MSGMPIGPPCHVPAPKSAWNPVFAPMAFTMAAELERTGRVSTGVFQMLLAGRTGHDSIICCPEADPAVNNPRTTTSEIDRTIGTPTFRLEADGWAIRVPERHF